MIWTRMLLLLQNYVRNLVNFDISVVGHLENFDKMQSYLDQGDNVVCLANHQTEADPGIMLNLGQVQDDESSHAQSLACMHTVYLIEQAAGDALTRC